MGLTSLFQLWQGGDRWEPPEIPNTDEVLVRPEPVEEEAKRDQQAPEVALDRPEASSPAPAAADADAATSAAAASAVDDQAQQSVDVQEEREKEQPQHRHRSGTCTCTVYIPFYILQLNCALTIIIQSDIIYEFLARMYQLCPPCLLYAWLRFLTFCVQALNVCARIGSSQVFLLSLDSELCTLSAD